MLDPVYRAHSPRSRQFLSKGAAVYKDGLDEEQVRIGFWAWGLGLGAVYKDGLDEEQVSIAIRVAHTTLNLESLQIKAFS